MTMTAILLAHGRPAFATLGEAASSVDVDRIHMQAAPIRVSTADRYVMHEMRAPSGATVHEYVASATGRVFAVAWNGPWQPDLRQMLGSYFDQYLQALQAASGRRARRGPLVIQQPNIVIEMGGQPRAFVGRVYLPQLLPAGIDTEMIR
jgi:Protein of unknown function (DUF2844)